MPAPLSAQTRTLVKATVPALEAHGRQIVAAMYQRLLADEAIAALFNPANQAGGASQHEALTQAILAYAKHIEDLTPLGPAIERIVNKHVSLQIQPEHYEHVARALLGAIEQVLGEAATPEILQAWGEAYWFLAQQLIDQEQRVYQAQREAEGGWQGWRAFRVSERVAESASIMSFILRPVDGQSVLRHRAGQYLSLLLDVPQAGQIRRNYTISCAPNGEFYRLSIKREAQGVASRWLHDQALVGTVLSVAAPCGDFYWQSSPERKTVLISAGVGLTPMVAMLESLASQGVETHYIHATQNSQQQAMSAHTRALASKCSVFYEQPSEADVASGCFDHLGRLTPQWLLEHTDLSGSEYFVCGPKPFMAMVIHALQHAGVSDSRIHYEFFGPATALA